MKLANGVCIGERIVSAKNRCKHNRNEMLLAFYKLC